MTAQAGKQQRTPMATIDRSVRRDPAGFFITLHNWVLGHVFVLFSSNAQASDLLVMPPSAYAAAARELVSLDFRDGYLARMIVQVANWLSGPAGSYARSH